MFLTTFGYVSLNDYACTKLSDVKNGFDYWATNKHPVLGDTIELFFKASVWKYSNLTVMNRTYATQVHPGWAENRTNITHYR